MDIPPSNFKDLTRKTFNRLTVIKRVENNIRDQARWLCECSCGSNKEVVVSSGDLKSNNVQSCGCLQLERLREAKKKYNIYDLSGEWGIGYTLKGEKFYFDLEDYDLIKDYCWSINDDDYVVAPFDKNHNILMHRLVTNCPKGLEVDHEFHDNFDCRKKFLRIVTPSQNQMNRKIHKNNTSGVKGVSWHKASEKWRAYISINKKHTELGYFDDFEEAVKVRKEAELKYYGEYRLREKKIL